MSSSRRSSRRAAAKSQTPIPPSVRRGLESLVDGNETTIQKMLSKGNGDMADELESVMRMNNLSAEMLLARFFDASVLSSYCEQVLKKSGKGSEATLAARIANEWNKPNFDPSLLTDAKKRKSQPDNEKNGQPKSKKRVSDNNDEGDTQATNDGEDGDWRKPLFFWRGTLRLEKLVGGKLDFQGSWVSGIAEDGLPSEQSFQDSKDANAFHLQSTSSKIKLKDSASSLIQALVDHRGKFKGSYLLDQGDGMGPQKTSDTSHSYAFASKMSGEFLVVAAAGKTLFGNFVSLGYVHHKEDTAHMILARRYVDESDARCSWWKNPLLQLQKWESSKTERTESPADSSEFWELMLPLRV